MTGPGVFYLFREKNLRITFFAVSLQSAIAEIAQLVERNLAKVEVAGPSPVFRSALKIAAKSAAIFFAERKTFSPPLLRSCPTRAYRLHYALGGCLPVVASLLPHGTAADAALAPKALEVLVSRARDLNRPPEGAAAQRTGGNVIARAQHGCAAGPSPVFRSALKIAANRLRFFLLSAKPFHPRCYAAAPPGHAASATLSAGAFRSSHRSSLTARA